MAQILQIVETDQHHEHFEPAVINDDWHALIFGDRTVCGMQLDGADGYGPGPITTGFVTCPLCGTIIDHIQAIRNWRPPT